MEIKTRILFLFKAYPFCLANYFRRALERRQDVELYTCGEFFGQWIPWNGGMDISMKYPNHVDLPLPRGMDRVSWANIKNRLPWKPDLIINVDAGFHLTTKPDVPYYVVATDPHVLGEWYAQVRPLADKFFNMQGTPYIQPGDVWLPYAFDPTVHYPEFPNPRNEKMFDACIVGLHYPQRIEWANHLRRAGVKTHMSIGDIYDEYRNMNNRAWIGLNWSSLQDVTARVFEIMAMRLVPVINRLPGLDELGFEDGRHYLGFSNMDEAVEKVLWAKNNPDFSKQIALEAYQFVHNHDMTYDNRIRQILSEFGV